MSARIAIDKTKIGEFCERWGIGELALFGSVLRDDFRGDSDVDILVTFKPDTHITLFDMVRMQDELSRMIGRDIDLVSRRGIERSENHIRKEAILSSIEVLHAA
jgi:uncharacterized protein